MQDIVTRMRESYGPSSDMILDEAADEIESLRELLRRSLAHIAPEQSLHKEILECVPAEK